MRKTGLIVLVLALVSAGALAGCFGSKDDGSGGTTPTSPTNGGNTPPTDDGSNPTPPTDDNSTNPTPPTQPGNQTPATSVNETFKFSVSAGTNSGTGQDPVPGVGSAKFVVPAAGWTTFTISINATGNGPNGEPPADGIEVTVTDAEGNAACNTHVTVAPGAPGTGEFTCDSGTPGEWTITARPTTVTPGFEVTTSVMIMY